MSFTFDGANRVIILGPGVTEFEVKDVYSRWKDWAGQAENLRFLPAFRVVGGDTTVGLNAIASYFFLMNGWRIRPQEAHHALTVSGILIGDEGAEVFADTLGPYRVRIVQVVPLQAETIAVAGGGGTAAPTAAQIASAVWSHVFVNKLLTVSKFLGLK